MALIIRIDVDRPYGRRPILRHILSRVSSDLYPTRLGAFGYLAELATMLDMLNSHGARAFVFFRRCTLPSAAIMERLDRGGHVIGLHLENSRSFETFREEVDLLECHVHRRVLALSKHGSGGATYGRNHYAPYEPLRYISWARSAGMNVVFGNLEDPRIEAEFDHGLTFFPSAFWLEPHWRDTLAFPVDWLIGTARSRDIVLLVHPENVLGDAGLTADFTELITRLESGVF